MFEFWWTELFFHMHYERTLAQQFQLNDSSSALFLIFIKHENLWLPKRNKNSGLPPRTLYQACPECALYFSLFAIINLAVKSCLQIKAASIHLFPFMESNLTETVAKKLFRKAKNAQGCQDRKELFQTPNVAHKLPNTVGTGLRYIVQIQ